MVSKKSIDIAVNEAMKAGNAFRSEFTYFHLYLVSFKSRMAMVFPNQEGMIEEMIEYTGQRYVEAVNEQYFGMVRDAREQYHARVEYALRTGAEYAIRSNAFNAES